MARFEALITPVIEGNDLRETLDQIAQQWGGSLTWLDHRNASLDLVSAGLPLKFLLELRRGDDLLLLVTSREGMGAGAPRTQELLEKQRGSRHQQLQPIQPPVVMRFSGVSRVNGSTKDQASER